MKMTGASGTKRQQKLFPFKLVCREPLLPIILEPAKNCSLCHVCYNILQRKHRREAMFNLEEEEEEGLTHYGQSLGDMQHFNELQLSSGEEEGEGKLLRDLVLID